MYASMLKEHYSKEGIATDQIIIDTQNPTGTALILVAENAENCIAVAPGANGALSIAHIEQISKTLEGADMVVMQAEIPYETIKQVALMAHRKGIKIMFNPAPACYIDSELMHIIDILVVNESEADTSAIVPSRRQHRPNSTKTTGCRSQSSNHYPGTQRFLSEDRIRSLFYP